MMSTPQEYAVTGMSCGHCESAIRSEVARIPGVQEIEVSADAGRLAITAEVAVEDAAVVAAVDEAGYRAVRT